MESSEVDEGLHRPWMSKREVNEPIANSSPGPSSGNMSEASGSSSSSHGRQGPSATKRTASEALAEALTARQLGPSPVKRQYQAPNIQNANDKQLKELDRLEKKEASIVNQLLPQLQLLHKRFNEERHQIVEEQRRLAERLEQIDSNEKTAEQAVREKHNRKLEKVRLDLLQLRQKMSLEGSTSSNISGMISSVALSLPSTSGRCDFSNALEIRRRLGSLDRQRLALLEQLYAATGSLSEGSSHVMDVHLHNCAPGREVAGSSTVTERVLPTSQHSEIAASSPESSEQAQSSGEEDSEINSRYLLLPLNGSASGNQANLGNATLEPHDELEPEPAQETNAADGEEEDEAVTDCKKSEIMEFEEKPEEEKKKKEEKDKDLEYALLKLKNIGALVEEELQCSICNELLVAAVTINCAHSFCKHCLGEWKKQRAECPMCRMPITAEHRSVTLDSLISTMVGQLSLELQQRHKEVVEERTALEAAALAASESSSGAQNGRQGSSSTQDHATTPQGRGGRHQNYNYNNNNNNNHWQPLPPAHHHAHHHTFVHPPNPHVGHYLPHAHAHSHPPHAHNHPPHAHSHPPHAHAALGPPPYHPPPLAHNPPPLGLGHSQGQQAGLQGLQGLQGQAQHEALDHHIRARRRHGRNMVVSSSSSSGSSTEEPSDTTSSFTSSGAFSSTSDRTWFETEYGEYEEDENEGEPRIVPGIPGRYYGGYGVCFYCNQRGHWSNGCPVRFGF